MNGLSLAGYEIRNDYEYTKIGYNLDATSMKAVILAAGIGKRMQPLTLEKPKPLLEVAGQPIIHWIWKALPTEINEVVMVIGYLGEMIQKYLGSEFLGKRITYVQQPKPQGTGHGLYLCRGLIKSGERFLFLFADDLYDRKSLKQCLRHDVAMLTAESQNPERFGVVIADQDSYVKEIEEKPRNPKSNQVSTGVWVLNNEIFNHPLKINPETQEYYLTVPLQKFIETHQVKAIPASLWLPIGYPEDLKKAEEFLLRNGN